MLESRLTVHLTMLRLERCEQVALGRRRQICNLLPPLHGAAPTPYRRFMDPIDGRVARLLLQKAMVAIDGVLIANKH
jgi:hypothetical protein